VVAHADDGDDVERAVRGSVAAATEPVTPGCAADAGGLWRDSAEFGEGPFIGDSVRVVAGGDQELSGDFDSDSMEFDQGRCRRADEGRDLGAE